MTLCGQLAMPSPAPAGGNGANRIITLGLVISPPRPFGWLWLADRFPAERHKEAGNCAISLEANVILGVGARPSSRLDEPPIPSTPLLRSGPRLTSRSVRNWLLQPSTLVSGWGRFRCGKSWKFWKFSLNSSVPCDSVRNRVECCARPIKLIMTRLSRQLHMNTYTNKYNLYEHIYKLFSTLSAPLSTATVNPRPSGRPLASPTGPKRSAASARSSPSLAT